MVRHKRKTQAEIDKDNEQGKPVKSNFGKTRSGIRDWWVRNFFKWIN